MQESTIDVQQQIAVSETPEAAFQELPWSRQPGMAQVVLL